MSGPLAAASAASHYVTWGVISISWGNLAVILVMIALFVAALLLPFPGGRGERDE